MSDTLGYLRIVRDGDDREMSETRCDGSKTFITPSGCIRRMNWDPKLTDAITGPTALCYVPAMCINTPVRLEPCDAPTWRTDVENVPKDGKTKVLLRWADQDETILTKHVSQCSGYTHWMLV